MLKDAALLTLDVAIELERLGLELHDGHPWNVLFEGCTPKFIDFGSICPKGTAGSSFLPQFVETFLYPLLLMANGRAKQARSLLVNRRTRRGRHLTRRDVGWQLALGGSVGLLLRFVTGRYGPGTGGRAAVLEDLRNIVSAIEVQLEQTAWSRYCDEEVDEEMRDQWMTKRKVAHGVLERLRPLTVLDIGSNTGWFSKLSALSGSRVVAFDVDEPSINRMYMNDEARRLSVLPLAMDFRRPTPAYGLNLRCPPAIERFKCDLVLGLAIVHHLVFKQNEDFDSIAEGLAEYSQRWLLVEFVPKEDRYVSEYFTENHDWYSLENFIGALERKFKTIEILPSSPHPRTLVLCVR